MADTLTTVDIVLGAPILTSPSLLQIPIQLDVFLDPIGTTGISKSLRIWPIPDAININKI